MPTLSEYQFRNTVSVLSQTCPSFRELLKTDPKAAIETLAQTTLPEELDVRLVEESGTEITLVIPPAPSRQLSEDELELVAGGIFDLGAGGNIGSVVDNSVNFVTNNFNFLGDVNLNTFFIHFAPQIHVDMKWFGLE